MCGGLSPTYWTTFGSAEKNRNGSCPMHEWDHPPIFPLHPPARGRWTPEGQGARRHTLSLHVWNMVWIRPRVAEISLKKPPKCKNSTLTPIVRKISFPPFSAPRGPLTPKRGEDTSGTRVRPHAKFGVIGPWVVEKCGEQEETSLHFLGECCANMQIRYSIFGAHLMQPSELHKVEPTTLLRFARATKRFS